MAQFKNSGPIYDPRRYVEQDDGDENHLHVIETRGCCSRRGAAAAVFLDCVVVVVKNGPERVRVEQAMERKADTDHSVQL